MLRSVSVAAAPLSMRRARRASIARGAAAVCDEGLFVSVGAGWGAGLAVTIRSGVSTMSPRADGVAAVSCTGSDTARFFSANGTPAARTMPPAITAIRTRDERRGLVIDAPGVQRAVAALTLIAESRSR